MDYVDIFGQPLEIKPAKAKARVVSSHAKRVDDPSEATEHHGFEVVGLSTADMTDARRKHQLEHEGSVPPVPFDPAMWVRNARRRRLVRKTFAIEESANLCASLLRKDGAHLEVEVRPILKRT